MTNDADRPAGAALRAVLLGHAARRHGLRPRGLRARRRGAWTLVGARSQLLNSNTVAEDPEVAAAVQAAARHGRRLRQLGRSAPRPQALSAARAVVEDVPIIDFVNYVQADAVKAGLTGADAALPVLSIAAPFNRTASFPAGQVTVRDVAGLYIYDNTLLGGEDHRRRSVKDYLEFSARYFKQVTGTGPVHDGPGDQRGHADRAERHPGLQLRLGRRPRRAADLRHRHRPGRSGRGSSNLAYGGAPVDRRPGSSCWRSTTTASPAAAASRPSRPRRSSTTARTRSAS